MTNHLLYEGPELEQLLERVRSAHGSEAAIVSANKVRRGGVAGFFAKEIFQVIVQPSPDDSDNLDELDGADLADLDQDSPVGRVTTHGDDEELWRLLTPTVSAPASPVAPVETFSEMLDRLVADHLMAATATASAEPGFTPLFAKPDSISIAAAVAPAADDARPAPTAWTPPQPPPPAAPRSLDQRTTAPSAIVTRRMPTPVDDEGTDGDVISLRPHRVRRSAAAVGGLEELLAQFENAWRDAGPLPTSGITVVVGEDDEARRAASTMAAAMGIDVDQVVVASPHDLNSLPTGAELAQVMSLLHRQGSASILVVELEPGIAGHAWARAVIDGVRPSRVDLATDAEIGFDQVRRTVIALGGVDAIDLLDVATSHSAEELLEMNIPIATLDGRPATPALWAATVLSRPGASVVGDEGLDRNESVGGILNRRSDERRSLGSTP